MKLPSWLSKRAPSRENIDMIAKMLSDLSLNTVCEHADCPNISECFSKKVATFMIMGNTCTRNCRFCAVPGAKPSRLDPGEPENVAKASKELGLRHVVVTSVTRDDLDDGGAEHFAKTIDAIRALNPQATVEVLIPDMQGDWKSLKIIVDAKPDVVNHNLETVERLYEKIRPEAVYTRSLELLKKVKEYDPKIHTKSGIMVGLGETFEEVQLLMKDLIEVGCSALTVGQYLRPSKDHLEVVEYVRPEVFERYKDKALNLGFEHVASAPFVRSSYNADEGMNELLNKEKIYG